MLPSQVSIMTSKSASSAESLGTGPTQTRGISARALPCSFQPSACKAVAAPFHLHGWPGVHFDLAGGGPACGGGGGGPACGVGVTGFATSAGAGLGGGGVGW